jgi:flavodoxin
MMKDFHPRRHLDALVSLLERYEMERLTLKGRLYLAVHEGNQDNWDTMTASVGQVSQKCAKIEATIAAIRETLGGEYDAAQGRILPDVQAAEGRYRYLAG